jgi:hypothetical protein
MLAVSRRAVRFVRALVGLGEARAADGVFRAGVSTLEATEVSGLVAAGVIAGSRIACRPSPMTRDWLRRQLAETDDPFAIQHRHEIRRPDGSVINLNESPLARLAAPSAGGGKPFLEPHQVEAGERVRRLCERARLQPRVTMSYSASHTVGGTAMNAAAEISDLAAEARKHLAEISRVLPPDCAGVVIDVCGLLKGLQTVETERGWPRRSAKLVLRIGLDQLARHYGLSSTAVGPASRRTRGWLDNGARPDRFE